MRIAGKSWTVLFCALLLLAACTENEPELIADRLTKIPAGALKITPQTDAVPPKLHSDEWENPVPLGSQINTAGAEDSPFITSDGRTLYFFFTPDVKVPVEKQLLDGVTGIYFSHQANGKWEKPERAILQDKKKLSLDGCQFVQDNKIWFCSAREGYTGLHWFTAEFEKSRWQNWNLSDFDPEYEVGELHFNKDETEVYFHSSRAGGKGGLDLWTSKKVGGKWSEPENLAEVNSLSNEGWPALSPDEKELWFSKDYGTWRSKKIGGSWSKPELIISGLAGEPSIGPEGNIYFVHHYFKGDQMLEADIYVAYRKKAAAE